MAFTIFLSLNIIACEGNIFWGECVFASTTSVIFPMSGVEWSSFVNQAKATIKALNHCNQYKNKFDSCKTEVKSVSTVTDEEVEEICTAAGCLKGYDYAALVNLALSNCQKYPATVNYCMTELQMVSTETDEYELEEICWAAGCIEGYDY